MRAYLNTDVCADARGRVIMQFRSLIRFSEEKPHGSGRRPGNVRDVGEMRETARSAREDDTRRQRRARQAGRNREERRRQPSPHALNGTPTAWYEAAGGALREAPNRAENAERRRGGVLKNRGILM